MKRVALPLVIVVGLTTSALAADMAKKAPPAPPPPPPSPWDVAITTAVMNDYNFRGITQSRHQPSVQGGFEVRYTFNPQWQLYGGISGESIDFPNHAAAEIDFYGGFRPTFDKLALDFGVWYYWYPGGECFNGDTTTPCAPPGAVPPFSTPAGFPTGLFLPNGNVVKGNLSFVEGYAKATYTINDQWAVGIQEWYSPSVLNSGAQGWFTTGNITFTVPSAWLSAWLPSGIGMSISGDGGYWALGTSDNFYCTAGFPNGTQFPTNTSKTGTGCSGVFPNGVPYQSYWTWDVGVSFTYKAFTLDLRYYDSNLTKAQCNVFDSDHTSTFNTSNITNLNPGGLGSNWCDAAFVAKLSFATNLSNIK